MANLDHPFGFDPHYLRRAYNYFASNLTGELPPKNDVLSEHADGGQ
jgi:hypothetical protein